MTIYVSVDSDNIIKSIWIPVSEGDKPIEDRIEVHTDLDIEKIFIVDNYKLCNGALIELTDEEKPEPIPQKPNEMEVLNEQVVALEKENKLLKAQVEVLSQTSDFHEELIVEMANKVYA